MITFKLYSTKIDFSKKDENRPPETIKSPKIVPIDRRESQVLKVQQKFIEAQKRREIIRKTQQKQRRRQHEKKGGERKQQVSLPSGKKVVKRRKKRKKLSVVNFKQITNVRASDEEPEEEGDKREIEIQEPVPEIVYEPTEQEIIEESKKYIKKVMELKNFNPVNQSHFNFGVSSYSGSVSIYSKEGAPTQNVKTDLMRTMKTPIPGDTKIMFTMFIDNKKLKESIRSRKRKRGEDDGHVRGRDKKKGKGGQSIINPKRRKITQKSVNPVKLDHKFNGMFEDLKDQNKLEDFINIWVMSCCVNLFKYPSSKAKAKFLRNMRKKTELLSNYLCKLKAVISFDRAGDGERYYGEDNKRVKSLTKVIEKYKILFYDESRMLDFMRKNFFENKSDEDDQEMVNWKRRIMCGKGGSLKDEFSKFKIIRDKVSDIFYKKLYNIHEEEANILKAENMVIIRVC